jgi:23S rRNA (cytosine1962-C5)-methyltransferase
MYPTIVLRPDKSSSVERKHPWVFSGAIDTRRSTLGELEEGDIVRCVNPAGQFLGAGHYSRHASIAVRILSFADIAFDHSFWVDRLQNALALRQRVVPKGTSGYRWIHGEGDHLPGLIVDVYGNHVVLQTHTSGMWRALPVIAEAVKAIMHEKIDTIYARRTDAGAGELDGSWLFGDAGQGEFLENGILMHADWQKGQKTGYFLDQRENRLLSGHYASGSRVLDLFCNMGGFSVHCLKGGAVSVVAVDASARALEHAEKNVVRNFENRPDIQFVESDCLRFLQQQSDMFDLIICDPPAYAKNLSKRHNAVQGYKRLNAAAMSKVKPGGLLFTFSCSQVVDEALFYNTMVAAGIESGRSIRVIHKLNQGPDHPVNLFHREGAYLKGLVLEVS